jgi:hypothetical protein
MRGRKAERDDPVAREHRDDGTGCAGQRPGGVDRDDGAGVGSSLSCS